MGRKEEKKDEEKRTEKGGIEDRQTKKRKKT